MKKLDQENIRIISRIGLFVVLIATIVAIMPKDAKFKYQYEIGKPWNYDLMTAPFDFPIYKTDEQLKADKQDLLKNYTPYFQQDNKAFEKQINNWETEWKATHNENPPHFYYVKSKLKEIYQSGVIASAMYEQVIKAPNPIITVVETNRTTTTLSVDEIYTPKTAYEKLFQDKPANISYEELNSYNMNLYITENLRYDSITSEAVKSDMFKNLSLTSGMVQAGERIIDKGEIVTPAVFSILNSMRIESEKKNSVFGEASLILLGETLVIFVLILLLASYFYLFRKHIYDVFKDLLFISLVIIAIVGAAAIVIQFTDLNVLVVPFCILPIIIRVFFDSRTALFVHSITIFIISFMVYSPFPFIILQISAGMVAIAGLKDLTARGQLAQTALFVFITYSVQFVAIELITEGNFSKISYLVIAYLGVSSILLLFAYVLIFILEKMFGYISDITLVELTNVNSELMLKFAEVAPGSFQHSLQVSNLATEAAKKINANSLLVRTGALYHDIGKMKNPQNFTENQAPGNNPLLKLSYEDAAQCVISHVADGVVLAKKNKIPEQIIGFITTHHGSSKTRYFYNSFINENPNVTPDESKFTYPGPLPYSKETSILMMADAVEARSRSMDTYTDASIQYMVNDMIDKQIADGQFKNAPISFRDVEMVKQVMVEKVKNMYHNRITYPELKKAEE